jgi:hypothetical protein|tara:strand:- start:1368 stop:1544 length:177 start_codon:yes stop_codon:yes gene_type:complete
MKCGALILLVIGVLFLLQDRGIWAFWGISWYTAAFLYLGLMKIGKAKCGMCKAEGKKK